MCSLLSFIEGSLSVAAEVVAVVATAVAALAAGWCSPLLPDADGVSTIAVCMQHTAAGSLFACLWLEAV